MASTMQQMLDALMARAGSNEGTGGNSGIGGGPGGGGQDGYSVAGNDTAIPAYGPDRLSFSASQPTSANGQSLKTAVGKNGANNRPLPSHSVKADDFRKNKNQTIIPENIPAKYRNAVKRYFSISNSTPDSESQ